jgi:ribosome biogenesis GTPase A
MTATDQIAQCPSIEEMLHALCAVDLAGKNRAIEAKLLSLEEKLSSGQLHLAVLGQMKRGKSSLINALLNANVLPTGILPVTAIITEIRYAQTPAATIVYATGGLRESVLLSDLASYITEDGNPGNKKQVASVEIVYPSPFLESGIILIDTPGIGSTHSHNTETTERYLGEVDAGIVVLSIDPPITEVEARFIGELKDEIPKLLFVLNKTDTASAAEVSDMVRFLESELDRQKVFSPEIFPLSALRDRSGSSGATGGLQIFKERLRTFLSKEKRQVLVRSVAMDVSEIASILRFAASMGARAETMDTEKLRNKRFALDRLMDETDTDIRELQLLLRQRSSDLLANVEHDLTAQVRDSVADVQANLARFGNSHPKETGRVLGTSLEEFLMKEVEAVFTRWRVHEDEKVQSQLTALSERFVAQANGILARLEQFAGSLFDAPVEHLTVRCPLRVESHLHFWVERIFYSLDAFLLLLPRFILRPIVLRRAHHNVPVLLDMNAGRIRYDYMERLQASVTRSEKDLLAALEMVTVSLKSVLNETPDHDRGQLAATMHILDSIRRDCEMLLR